MKKTEEEMLSIFEDDGLDDLLDDLDTGIYEEPEKKEYTISSRRMFPNIKRAIIGNQEVSEKDS